MNNSLFNDILFLVNEGKKIDKELISYNYQNLFHYQYFFSLDDEDKKNESRDIFKNINHVDLKILKLCHHVNFKQIYKYKFHTIRIEAIYHEEYNQMKEFSLYINDTEYISLSTDKKIEPYVFDNDFDKFKTQMINIFDLKFLDISEILHLILSLCFLPESSPIENFYDIVMIRIAKINKFDINDLEDQGEYF